MLLSAVGKSVKGHMFMDYRLNLLYSKNIMTKVSYDLAQEVGSHVGKALVNRLFTDVLDLHVSIFPPTTRRDA